MTCGEFRALLIKSPLDCTVAERAAVAAHNNLCRECRKGRAIKAEKSSSMADRILAFTIGIKIARMDARDPESLSVIVDSLKEKK